jgi:hypothetical protein
LELRGGNDKLRKGVGAGHRRDTVPICQAVIDAGWACRVVQYHDDAHASVRAACAQADGVLVRAGAGAHKGATRSKLRELLHGLLEGSSSSAGGARAPVIMPHPTVAQRLGAKSMLAAIAGVPGGLGAPTTCVYRSAEELAAGVARSLASGPRVLKASRGTQGRGVWRCSLVSAAFPSLIRFVVTGIYQCHACSCHAIED